MNESTLPHPLPIRFRFCRESRLITPTSAEKNQPHSIQSTTNPLTPTDVPNLHLYVSFHNPSVPSSSLSSSSSSVRLLNHSCRFGNQSQLILIARCRLNPFSLNNHFLLHLTGVLSGLFLCACLQQEFLFFFTTAHFHSAEICMQGIV